MDFVAGVGTNALTLLAPLRDYGCAKGFHLLYEEAAEEGAAEVGAAAEAEVAGRSKAAETPAGEGIMAGGSAGEAAAGERARGGKLVALGQHVHRAAVHGDLPPRRRAAGRGRGHGLLRHGAAVRGPERGREADIREP